MKLSDTKIRALKRSLKVQKVPDGQGLYLFVNPTGSKLWRYLYRFDGKQRTLAIGPYPEITLSEAREKRLEANRLRLAGTDPNLVMSKKAQKLQRQDLFYEICEEFHDYKCREGRSQKTITKNRQLLRKAQSSFGSRPIGEIESAEVLAFLKQLEAKGLTESVHRTQSLISAVFNYAIITQRAKSNPTDAIKGAIARKPSKNRSAITDPKPLGGLLRAIDGFNGNYSTLYALKILPYVFTRPGELRLAKWEEFDFKKKIWTIPAGRMKARKEHLVPLADQVIMMFNEIKQITGSNRLIFPGTRSQDRAISENTLNGALRNLGYTGDQMTAHGFRATASSLLYTQQKWPDRAIEAQLAHKDRNEIRAAYNRYDYWKERVKMMQWWASSLNKLKETK